MAKYANLTDVKDNAITVLEEDLLQADRMIDGYLENIGVNPDDVVKKDLLKDVAVAYACFVASAREAMGDNTLYIDKAKQYEKQYKDLLKLVSAKSLGVSNALKTGTVKVFRG